jgi:hypothetical protein
MCYSSSCLLGAGLQSQIYQAIQLAFCLAALAPVQAQTQQQAIGIT